jgi:Flp pilus assembly protein TadD
MRKQSMRKSVLLVAVSSTALFSGCARNTDNAFKDIVPTAKAAAIAPSAVAPLTQLAQEALSRGDAAAAIPLAERALESAPGNSDAMLALAQAHLMSGDAVKAEQVFRETLKIDTKSSVANTGLGLSLLAQQRLDEARSVLRVAAGQNPPVATLSNIAFAMALAGAPDEAVKLLDPVALSKDSSPQLRQNLAFALVMADNRARAFDVAGYDLDGVAAARQVASWSEVARKPFDQRLTEMAGLHVVDHPALAMSVAKPVSQPVVATENVAPATVDVTKVAALQSAPLAVEKVEVKTSKQENRAPEQGLVLAKASQAPRVEDISRPAVVVQVVASVAPALRVSTKPAQVVVEKIEKPVIAVAQKSEPVDLRPVVLRPKASPVAVSTISLTTAPHNAVSAKPLAVASTLTPKFPGWVVQIGAVILTSDRSKEIIRRIDRAFGKKTGARIVVVDTPNGKLHRILLGQAQNRSVAVKTCAQIKAKGHACFPRSESTVTAFNATARPVTTVKLTAKSVKL